MKLKNKILCKFGKHHYKPVLRTYDVFSTSWTDTGGKDYWSAHFLKCNHCGVRKFETDYRYSYSSHKGLDKAKHQWLDYGTISDYIKNPQKYHQYNQPKSPEKNRLTTSEKIDKLLLKALDTTSENEAMNCLKMARKAYHAKG